MRVVVVGSTGNVGSAIIRRLAGDRSIEVIGVSRRLPRFEGAYAQVDSRSIDVSSCVSDSASARRLDAALEGADAVVHLAWLLQPNHDEPTMWRTNVGGLKNVLASAARMHVPHVIVASSVGAYSPGPKTRAVDETWPTGGIHSSHYARHKAQSERVMDEFEAEHPETTLARLRPGLVMQRDAASEVVKLFVGNWIPLDRILRRPLPVVPVPNQLVSQVIDATDLAEAVALMLAKKVRGAFNLAAEPTIGPDELAAALGSKRVRVSKRSLRALIDVTWQLRVQQTDPGWLDLACAVPIMSTARARTELGWSPKVDGRDALAALIAGIKDRDALAASPQLRRPEGQL